MIDDGTIVLTFTENAPDCINTGSRKYHYIRVGQNGVTQEGVNAMLSTSLAAAMANKTVAINYDTSTKYCYINRLYISFP